MSEEERYRKLVKERAYPHYLDMMKPLIGTNWENKIKSKEEFMSGGE